MIPHVVETLTGDKGVPWVPPERGFAGEWRTSGLIFVQPPCPLMLPHSRKEPVRARRGWVCCDCPWDAVLTGPGQKSDSPAAFSPIRSHSRAREMLVCAQSSGTRQHVSIYHLRDSECVPHSVWTADTEHRGLGGQPGAGSETPGAVPWGDARRGNFRGGGKGWGLEFKMK